MDNNLFILLGLEGRKVSGPLWESKMFSERSMRVWVYGPQESVISICKSV